ncbi:VPLPA-CTERM sorting domain-containing protein [Tropicimonas sp. IMCC6043]|uniref:VPLPA-CTERM sorting domain-containing protein n=1 Tax=Tropicimonas sp. IMCC6043 TaxID=2510645 RepID=UPI0013EC809D|nr:VPLPA-CTERM sorting domain-containing protein [Tropicimonas sp. IMCC6043]
MLKTLLTLACLAHAGIAGATVITSQDFSTDPVLAESQTAGAWYTDRYAPAAFESQEFIGDGRLAVTISADDSAAGRPAYAAGAFYNTQGRKFDLGAATTVSIDFYIDPSFENAAGRFGGIWGTGIDAGGAVSAYPILEFFDNQFMAFDFLNGGWIGLGLPTGFAYGEFVTLSISLNTHTDQFTYSVSDEALLTGAANGTVGLADVILQNVNTDAGVDRTLYFDNFVATLEPAPVPLPAGLPLVLTGLGALGLAARRRR